MDRRYVWFDFFHIALDPEHESRVAGGDLEFLSILFFDEL